MSKVIKHNLTTLANANELAVKIIMGVSGEAVANTVNGELLTTSDLRDAVAAKMQATLTKKFGAF